MLSIRLVIEAWAPFPIDNMAITAATPITMPSVVRADRILFLRSARNAVRSVRE
jgi:hypothetical protein